MADVSDRAQLILVSGLTIAVTLLVLVVLLNTVIYTENVASRGMDSGVGDARSIHETIVDETGGILAEANVTANTTDELYIPNGVDLLLDQQRSVGLYRGRLTRSNRTIVTGLYVTNGSTHLDASGVDRVRTLNLTNESMDPGTVLTVTVGNWSAEINRTEDDIRITS